MSRRRPVVVLLLIAAVTALALSGGLGVTAASDGQGAGRSGEAALGRESGSGLDSAVVRVRLDERRIIDQRSSKTGLALLAVLGVLALVPLLVPPRKVAASSPVAVPAVWWSPISGRAPPKFQLAVV